MTLKKVTYSVDYTIIKNTDESTKIIETTKLGELAQTYMQELTIQKDNYFLTTWFNSLKDEELLRFHSILETVMRERNIIK